MDNTELLKEILIVRTRLNMCHLILFIVLFVIFTPSNYPLVLTLPNTLFGWVGTTNAKAQKIMSDIAFFRFAFPRKDERTRIRFLGGIFVPHFEIALK